MKRVFKHGLAYIALAASIPFATTPTQAALLAYDGFDYTQGEGTSIAGLNGGLGWDAAFPTPSGTMVLAPGLSYAGLNPVGKAMQWSPNANTGAGRAWDSTAAAPASGTYWFSVLVNANGISQGNFNWMFSTLSGNGQNGIGFRTSNLGDGTLNFKPVTPNTDGNVNPQAGTGTAGTPAFIVGRLVLDTTSGSTWRIWVNPSTNPQTPPTDADPNSAQMAIDASQSQTVRASIAGRCFSSGGGDPTANKMEYDEVRIGQSFAEVLPSVTFWVSPSSAIENLTLTVGWANIPPTATSIVLNPGNINLLTFTSNGAGQTTVQSPGTNVAYVLTFTVGSVTTSLTNQFTAIAPSYVITPAAAWQGDTITHSWQVPVGCTAVSIDHPEIGDVLPYTSGENGTGTITSIAPGTNATWILSYTYNSSTLTLTQSFTMGAAYMTIPTPVIEHSPVPITWRIPVGFSAVSLEYGPLAGPYSAVDVTANTVLETGAGTYTHNPNIGDVSYFVRYTNAGIGYVLSSNIVVNPEIFTNLVAVNNTKPVIINPSPMKDGVAAYSDRTHAWADVPSILQGAQFVKFGQDDKFTAGLQVSFNAATNATFFLLIDNRIGDGTGGVNAPAGTDHPPTLTNALNMAWVLSSGFVDSGVDIGLDENFVAGAKTVDQTYSVFFRQVAAGETFTFGDQNDGGSRNMYGVAGVAPQVVPVAFWASQNTVTYPDPVGLNWTVPIGSTVTIDNGIGDVTSLTGPNGIGSTNIYAPVGTNTYILTYDPPGAATPPITLTPLVVTVQPHPPVVFTYTVNGTSMDFSWPVEYIGWILQQQTNSLGVGLSTNWVDVPGWEGGNTATVTIEPSVPASFFRLRRP